MPLSVSLAWNWAWLTGIGAEPYQQRRADRGGASGILQERPNRRRGPDQEQGKDPRVQRCIDAWLAKAVGILNRRARDRAPWSVSPYGHLLNKQVHGYGAPDGWAGKYGSSKHSFVWQE